MSYNKRLLDKIVVVDLECSCFAAGTVNPPRGEIIQIGARLLDVRTLEIGASLDYYVRPTHSAISDFCTELTGITPADVAESRDLMETLPILEAALGTKERVWGSFGDFDRVQFEQECARKGLPYPFGPRHVNIKTLLALTENWTKELGMAGALDRLGMPLLGRHHNAADDSYNIAALLAHVLGHNVAARGLRT